MIIFITSNLISFSIVCLIYYRLQNTNGSRYTFSRMNALLVSVFHPFGFFLNGSFDCITWMWMWISFYLFMNEWMHSKRNKKQRTDGHLRKMMKTKCEIIAQTYVLWYYSHLFTNSLSTSLYMHIITYEINMLSCFMRSTKTRNERKINHKMINTVLLFKYPSHVITCKSSDFALIDPCKELSTTDQKFISSSEKFTRLAICFQIQLNFGSRRRPLGSIIHIVHMNITYVSIILSVLCQYKKKLYPIAFLKNGWNLCAFCSIFRKCNFQILCKCLLNKESLFTLLIFFSLLNPWTW